ncbi:conjugal transfer protein TrbK, partial [Caulobacter sp. D4A]
TSSSRPAVQAPAPVDARLQRCQALGAAGAQDPECLQAWEAARTRFLGRARADR